MFPIYVTLPKYKESILVSIVDKLVSTYEFLYKLKLKFKYLTNLSILTLFAIIK